MSSLLLNETPNPFVETDTARNKLDMLIDEVDVLKNTVYFLQTQLALLQVIEKNRQINESRSTTNTDRAVKP